MRKVEIIPGQIYAYVGRNERIDPNETFLVIYSSDITTYAVWLETTLDQLWIFPTSLVESIWAPL